MKLKKNQLKKLKTKQIAIKRIKMQIEINKNWQNTFNF